MGLSREQKCVCSVAQHDTYIQFLFERYKSVTEEGLKKVKTGSCQGAIYLPNYYLKPVLKAKC